jgi:hypothetical protein
MHEGNDKHMKNFGQRNLKGGHREGDWSKTLKLILKR